MRQPSKDSPPHHFTSWSSRLEWPPLDSQGDRHTLHCGTVVDRHSVVLRLLPYAKSLRWSTLETCHYQCFALRQVIRASECLPFWTLLTRVAYVENTMPSLNSEDKPNALQTKRMKNTYNTYLQVNGYNRIPMHYQEHFVIQNIHTVQRVQCVSTTHTHTQVYKNIHTYILWMATHGCSYGTLHLVSLSSCWHPSMTLM